MKNTFLKTIGAFALAILMSAMFMQISVSAQDKSDTQQIDEQTNNSFPDPFGRSAQSIEGVWRTTVTQRNCQTGDAIRTFRGLVTFHQGGTISETSTAIGPALRSAGHGVWEKVSPTEYFGTFAFLVFSPDGTFVGTQKITQNFVLGNVLGGFIGNRSKDNYSASGTLQFSDVNDNLIVSGCATSVATRFQ
ncbi:MAG: hypothetical protein ABI891_12290 [Acidobacteriota bacterium]